MTPQNKETLSSIESAIENDDSLNINNRKDIAARDIIIIKRDGREEPYDVNKMRRVCLWACDNVEAYANELLENTRVKIYDKIKITDVYKELIKTAANKISRLYPAYENIAAKLLLLNIYRDTANIKKNTQYTHLKEVIDKGLKYKKYNKAVFESYSEEDIELLNQAINPDNDYLFTYKSLSIFNKKYCLNYSKNKKFELPQHTYMRIAMTLFYKEVARDRLHFVIEFYKLLSGHYFTLATPIMLNAGTPHMQLSSCVLSKMGDSAESIMDTTKDIAIYSKNKGGNAVDISEIRASGSYILGNNGISSGPVPFIKIIESTIKAFNQGSDRPGVCCVYFQWWHMNFEELVVLKSNSGTEENRARQLKYSVKINDLLIKRALANQDVALFNPSDVPKLIGLWGKEFEEEYERYEALDYLPKKIMPARKILELLFKERVENGNIYLFHEENVNNASLLNRYINSSNLCCEITLPSRASNIIEEKIIHTDGNEKEIIKRYKAGEISLCNLCSINLVKWGESSKEKQQDLVNILVRGLDNTVDVAEYPVCEGEITNKKYRYLGIGVLNYANYLATKKIVIDTNEALEETSKIFDELSYQIISASVDLAKIKGRFEAFEETQWAEGKLPILKANKLALKLTKYQPDWKKWEALAKEIQKYGIRNAQLMAIAPTATSGKAINATESIEPIQDFLYKEDGKINVTTLAPNLQKNSKYYKRAIDCDQYQLINLAAIRQMYLDQAQSINIYFKKVSSLTDFSMYHFYGFALGIKTFYYCKTEKEVTEEVCESCT